MTVLLRTRPDHLLWFCKTLIAFVGVGLFIVGTGWLR